MPDKLPIIPLVILAFAGAAGVYLGTNGWPQGIRENAVILWAAIIALSITTLAGLTAIVAWMQAEPLIEEIDQARPLATAEAERLRLEARRLRIEAAARRDTSLPD